MAHQEFSRVPRTNIRIQTIAIASHTWKWSMAQIADEYDLTEAQVRQALRYYQTHRQILDEAIATEQAMEPKLEETRHLSE
jgi:uncharacterized protein (DUF433 family)